MRAYIDVLSEETLNDTIRYVIPGAVRISRLAHPWWMSSSMPRSTAARPPLLTNYGQSPGDYDFTMFANERLI